MGGWRDYRPGSLATGSRQRREDAIDLTHVIFIEIADGGLQAQLLEDRVVASRGKLALGRENLLLRVEYVNIDAYADVVAEFVRGKRRFARRQRLFECADLVHAADDVQKTLFDRERLLAAYG